MTGRLANLQEKIFKAARRRDRSTVARLTVERGSLLEKRQRIEEQLNLELRTARALTNSKIDFENEITRFRAAAIEKRKDLELAAIAEVEQKRRDAERIAGLVQDQAAAKKGFAEFTPKKIEEIFNIKDPAKLKDAFSELQLAAITLLETTAALRGVEQIDQTKDPVVRQLDAFVSEIQKRFKDAQDALDIKEDQERVTKAANDFSEAIKTLSNELEAVDTKLRKFQEARLRAEEIFRKRLENETVINDDYGLPGLEDYSERPLTEEEKAARLAAFRADQPATPEKFRLAQQELQAQRANLELALQALRNEAMRIAKEMGAITPVATTTVDALSPMTQAIKDATTALGSFRASLLLRSELPPTPTAIKDASGGQIYGTDSVPALLSPGEFVVNAGATRQFYSQLLAMNSGVSRFANGGPVTNVTGDFNVSVNTSGNESVDVQRIGTLLRREIRRGTISLV